MKKGDVMNEDFKRVSVQHAMHFRSTNLIGGDAQKVLNILGVVLLLRRKRSLQRLLLQLQLLDLEVVI